MHELRALLRLAAPIVGVQLGMRAMSTVDVMMVGRVSEDAMAAVAVGNAWLWVVTIFCVGFLMATDPLFSQAVGAGDDAAISRTMQRGLTWALALTLPAIALIWQVDGMLDLTAQPAQIRPDAADYARIASLGTMPVLLFGVLRQGLQAHSQLRALLVTMLLANAFNAFANWVLVFGNLGVPALGVAGSAWATVASRWLMAILLLGGGWSLLGRHVLSFRDATLRARALRLGPMLHVAALGLPIGLQISVELGVFAATTLTVGQLGSTQLAGHQITLDLASTSFMVPVGLGVAGSVRVGHAIGRGDMVAARLSSRVVLTVGTAIMTVFALLFLTLPETFARLYTPASEAISVAALLIPIAGVFQVFDGLQTVSVGVLRGLGETRMPLWINIVGFWGIGFPAGLLLCFRGGLGAAGMWWGLVIGLGCVAVALAATLRSRLRHDLARIAVD